MNIFDKISQKLNIKSNKTCNGITNPIVGDSDDKSNEFLNRMTKNAINLYERQCDIKNFTKLALSNPENTLHNKQVEELLKDGVFDPLEDEIIKELASNKELLRDLGLD